MPTQRHEFPPFWRGTFSLWRFQVCTPVGSRGGFTRRRHEPHHRSKNVSSVKIQSRTLDEIRFRSIDEHPVNPCIDQCPNAYSSRNDQSSMQYTSRKSSNRFSHKNLHLILPQAGRDLASPMSAVPRMQPVRVIGCIRGTPLSHAPVRCGRPRLSMQSVRPCPSLPASRRDPRALNAERIAVSIKTAHAQHKQSTSTNNN